MTFTSNKGPIIKINKIQNGLNPDYSPRFFFTFNAVSGKKSPFYSTPKFGVTCIFHILILINIIELYI